MTSSSSNNSTCGFLKRSPHETVQQQHTLRKDLKREAKIVIWDISEKVLSDITQQRKGGVKEFDQEARLSETIPQTRKTGRSPSGKEDRLPRFNCTRKEIVAMIENVITCITHNANTSERQL